MTDSELKKRTIKCTDAEWDEIVSSGLKMGKSPSRFIIAKALLDRGDGFDSDGKPIDGLNFNVNDPDD